MYPKCPKPAFSLTTVLMVLVVCMALTAVSLRQVGMAKMTHLERMRRLEATWAAESGLAHALSYLENIHQWGELGGLNGKTLTWPSGQSAKIQVRETLGFVRVTVTGMVASGEHVLDALVGQKPLFPETTRLVIAEGPEPFYTSGETSIQGDVFLPGGVLQPRELHGVAASRYPFVDGEIAAFETAQRLQIAPFSKDAIIREITQARTTLLTQVPKLADLETWSLDGKTVVIPGDFTVPNHIQSVQGPGKLLVQGRLTLAHPLEIRGFPLLVTGGDFISDSDLLFSGSIYAGGDLHFSGKTRGFCFLVGGQRMHFGPETDLGDASSIWLAPMQTLNPQGQATVMMEGKIRGVIASWADYNVQTLIRVMPSAEVSGSILAQDRLILEAPMAGQVATRKFETLRGARSFDNWLRGTQIRSMDQPLEAVPFGFGQGSKVLGWIKR